MHRKLDLKGYDRSSISLTLLSLILISSVLFSMLNFGNGGFPGYMDTHGEGGMETWLRIFFRLGCAYLSLHTAVFWMIRNPDPSTMIVLFREELEIRVHKSVGLEKLGTFSAWTMIVFGLSMFVNGVGSIYVGLGYAPPEWVQGLGVSLFATSFGAASLTSIVVRYVILPSMVKQGSDQDHMFKPHEQVMHNWVLLLLSIDFLLGGMSFGWPVISLSIIMGGVYLTFAEIKARRKGGYYVYEFIDPRPALAPFLLSGLLIICLLSLLFGLLISALKQDYYFISFILLTLFVTSSVQFKPLSGDPR